MPCIEPARWSRGLKSLGNHCTAVRRTYSSFTQVGPLATKYVMRRVGSILNAYGTVYDSTYSTNVMAVSEEKTPTAKRARPKGIEILFNGTTVYSNRVAQNIGTWIETTEGSPGVSATVIDLVPCPQVGPAPYGVAIPDKYWSTDLRSKIRDADINIAQAFAERAQVEGMFVNYGKRLVKAYSAVRKGNADGVIQALTGAGRPPKGWKKHVYNRKDVGRVSGTVTGVASDTWLAWQYGIRPLISDLEGAVKEYYKTRSVQPIIRTFSARGSNSERGGGTLSGVRENYTTSWTQNARVRCSAQFQDSASAWDATAQRVGLTDPLLLAWELIPYSFVIDWFINVGDFLQASGTFIGLSRVGISITTTTVEESHGTKNGGSSNRKTVTKYREFRNSIPPAELLIKAHPLSISHVTSALALIRQVRF